MGLMGRIYGNLREFEDEARKVEQTLATGSVNFGTITGRKGGFKKGKHG